MRARNLTAGSDPNNLSVYTTDSISPTKKRLILAAVAQQDSIESGPPTLSGCNLTWVQVDTIIYNTSGGSERLILFRAMGLDPVPGPVTITGSSAYSGCSWVIDELDVVDTDGTNGSAAVVQSAKNSAAGVATATPLTVTLAAFSSAENRTYSVFVDTRGALTELTPEHTLLGRTFHISPQNHLMTQWNPSAADTTASATPSGTITVQIAGIAIEVKAGTEAQRPVYVPVRRGATRQPHNVPRINWANPITDALDIAAMPHMTGVLGPLLISTTPASPPFLGSVYGKSFDARRSSRSSSEPKYSVLTSNNYRTSLVFLQGYGTSSTSTLFAYGSFNGRGGSWAIERSSAGLLARVRDAADAAWITVSQGSLTNGRLVGVVRFTPGLTELFINGVKVAETAGAVASTQPETMSATLVGTTENRTVLGLSWNRALSNKEIRALAVNPWQVFVGEELPLVRLDSKPAPTHRLWVQPRVATKQPPKGVPVKINRRDWPTVHTVYSALHGFVGEGTVRGEIAAGYMGTKLGAGHAAYEYSSLKDVSKVDNRTKVTCLMVIKRVSASTYVPFGVFDTIYGWRIAVVDANPTNCDVSVVGKWSGGDGTFKVRDLSWRRDDVQAVVLEIDMTAGARILNYYKPDGTLIAYSDAGGATDPIQTVPVARVHVASNVAAQKLGSAGILFALFPGFLGREKCFKLASNPWSVLEDPFPLAAFRSLAPPPAPQFKPIPVPAPARKQPQPGAAFKLSPKWRRTRREVVLTPAYGRWDGSGVLEVAQKRPGGFIGSGRGGAAFVMQWAGGKVYKAQPDQTTWVLCFSTTATALAQGFGTVDSVTSYVEDLFINSSAQASVAGSLEMFVRDDAGVGLAKSTLNIGINDGRPHTTVWRFLNGNFSCHVDGRARTLTTITAGSPAPAIGLTEFPVWLNVRNLRGAEQNPADANQKIYLYARLPYLVSEAEAVSLSRNPWQLFEDPHAGLIFTGAVVAVTGIYRPTGDYQTTGWTAVPGPSHYGMLDEVVADDADYVYAAVPTPEEILNFSLPEAGNWTVRVRANVGTGSGTLTLRAYNASGTLVGSSTQAISNVIATYDVLLSVSEAAVRLSVQVT